MFPSFVGDAETVRLAKASVEGIDDIYHLLSDHGVDCDFKQGGWVWAAAAKSQLGAWDSTLKECHRLGVSPFRVLERDELLRRTGSSVHIAGVYDKDTARVHPAKYVRGLRKVALDLGVRIYEHSPMLDLDQSNPAVVRTPDGSVTSQKVVLATNVWAAGMPEFRRYIVAISSDMVITEPIPDRLEEIGWTDGECVSDSQMMIHYYQPTADGRIAFGKGGWGVALGGRIGSSFDRNESRAIHVREGFRRLYPTLSDVQFVDDWSGAIDRSVIGLPLIGHTNGNRHIIHAVGWSANAVGPSRVGGKFIASLVQNADDEWTRSPLVNLPPQTFPPEPIRCLGAHIVRTGVARKEAKEVQGKRPSRLSVFLSKQVPSGLIPKE